MKFTNSVVIRRPPGEVFAYLADPESIPRWNNAITFARQTTPGPVGVGTRFRQIRTIPRPAEEELAVMEFVPDRHFVLQGDLGPGSGSLGYELEAVPEGTRLTNRADLRAKGPLGIVVELGAGRIKAAVADNLEELKRILERV